MLYCKNDLPIYYCRCLIIILVAAVLASHSPRTYIYKSQHEIIMADLNRYTAKTLYLLITLMDDVIMYTYIWTLADVISSYKLLQFIDASLVISHLFIHQSKRKRSNEGWKVSLSFIVKWMNLNQIKRSLVLHWYPTLWEKNGLIFPPLVGLMYVRQAGRQIGRQNACGFQNFKNSLQVKLFRVIFCLTTL